MRPMYLKNDNVIEENRKGCEKCPVCDNRIGFAFGTCVDCGFNYIEADFRYIKVDVRYLPLELREALIREHAKWYGVNTLETKRYEDDYEDRY